METPAALCSFDIDYLTALLFPPSCVPHPNGVSRRHNGEVRNLGHRRSGALPQFGADVLQRSAGGHRGLRHHKRGTSAALDRRRFIASPHKSRRLPFAGVVRPREELGQGAPETS